MAAKTKKPRKSGANPAQNGDETATEVPPVRYAFAPLLQQFRSHTKRNEARLWMPIETNLISRYEFAALSPQNRYIFVAILLYCAGNGINEIPLDARFMSSVLIVDERLLKKSFDELLFQKLLLEKKEKTDKKSADRQDENASRVSVDIQNSFFSDLDSRNDLKNETPEEVLLKEDIPPLSSNGKSKLSKFSIEECLKYVEQCAIDGEAVRSPKALAAHLHKTGEADTLIFKTLFPREAELAAAESYGEPVKFLDQPCVVCFGAKMADTDGNGFRACANCKNERGKATGKQPEGERTQ